MLRRFLVENIDKAYNEFELIYMFINLCFWKVFEVDLLTHNGIENSFYISMIILIVILDLLNHS